MSTSAWTTSPARTTNSPWPSATGTLYRNFQGYSTHADCDLIGIGMTSIGKVGNTYAQNERELDEYYAHIDAGRLAVFRGIELSRDDEIRRDVITRLICHFGLTFADVERRLGDRLRGLFRRRPARSSTPWPRMGCWRSMAPGSGSCPGAGS